MNTQNRNPSRRGSAAVIVLAVIAIVVIYTLSISVTLRQLRSDLKLIEKQQLKKFAAKPASP